MAGANGINKYGLVNRENQFQPLQTYGTIFNEPNLQLIGGLVPGTTFTSNIITAQQFLSDWIFNDTNPLILTAPSNTDLNQLFEQQSKYEVGNSFTVSIQNFGVRQHVIIFPAGYVNPFPIGIPPQSFGTVTFELVGIPCQFQMTNNYWGVANNLPISNLLVNPGAQVGDLLEWDGGQWQPTSLINNSIPAALNRIRPFPPGAAPPFLPIFLESGIIINEAAPTPGVPVHPFQGIGDTITLSDAGVFTANQQANIQALNQAIMTATEPSVLCSNFNSIFSGVTAPFAALGTPNSIWHLLGYITPGGAHYGLDVGGQFFGTQFNVVSDRTFKKNITPVEFNSRELNKLQPYRYHYNFQSDSDPLTIGLMADELSQIVPASATSSHLQLVPLITALIGYTKHLESRVSQLENSKHPI